MGWKQSNFSESTLLQAAAAADTTLYIDADEVDTLPSLGVGDKAKMVIFGVISGVRQYEIVNITAWNTNGTLTVERAQEATVAQDWAAGVRAVHTPTAEVLQTLLDAIALTLFEGTATGTNAITVTLPSTIPVPSDGDKVGFRVANANTAAVTIEITNGSTSIGPYDLVHQDGSALDAGDLADEWYVEVRYRQAIGDFVLVTQASHQYEIDKINDGPIDGVNLLPNGDFSTWNQGTSFTTPASGTEVADGMSVIYDGTIGAFTFSRQELAFDVGVEGNPKYFGRWDQSSAGVGSTVRKVRIPMRRVNRLAGEAVTASIWLKADSARTVTGRIIQSFGTGGTPSADVVSATEAFSVTTDWTKFDISATLASILTKTLGSDDNDATILELLLPVNTSMTIDMASAQLEYGDRATRSHPNYPLPWWLGGTGGSWDDHDEFLETLWSELYALSNIAATGFLARNSANTYVGRTLTTTSAAGFTITNPAGAAGNPVLDLSTGLVQYAQDPMSVAELASVTGTFGTAAFIADSTLVHLAGTETITGVKTSQGVVDADQWKFGNTTLTHQVTVRWTNSGAVFRFVPAPSGTPDTTKSLSYNFSTSQWNTAGDFVCNGVLFFANGSAANPSLAAANDVNTGIYFPGSDNMDIATGGVFRWRFNSVGEFRSQGSAYIIATGDGSVTAPGFAFTSDPNTGLYRIGTDNMGIALNGTLYVDLSTSRMLLGSGMDIQLNAATGPASVTSLGFRGVPNLAGTKSGNYTTVLTDAGGCVQCSATLTLTIPPNSSVAYPIDTVIMIENLNGSGNVTVHPDTGVTLRRGDAIAGTGDRVVAADSAAYIKKKATNEWYIYGLFT